MVPSAESLTFNAQFKKEKRPVSHARFEVEGSAVGVINVCLWLTVEPQQEQKSLPASRTKQNAVTYALVLHPPLVIGDHEWASCVGWLSRSYIAIRRQQVMSGSLQRGKDLPAA